MVNQVLLSQVTVFLEKAEGRNVHYDVVEDFFRIFEISQYAVRASILRELCANFPLTGWSIENIETDQHDIVLSGINYISFVRVS